MDRPAGRSKREGNHLRRDREPAEIYGNDHELEPGTEPEHGEAGGRNEAYVQLRRQRPAHQQEKGREDEEHLPGRKRAGDCGGRGLRFEQRPDAAVRIRRDGPGRDRDRLSERDAEFYLLLHVQRPGGRHRIDDGERKHPGEIRVRRVGEHEGAQRKRERPAGGEHGTDREHEPVPVQRVLLRRGDGILLSPKPVFPV